MLFIPEEKKYPSPFVGGSWNSEKYFIMSQKITRVKVLSS
jgi:hypothetical protein